MRAAAQRHLRRRGLQSPAAARNKKFAAAPHSNGHAAPLSSISTYKRVAYACPVPQPGEQRGRDRDKPPLPPASTWTASAPLRPPQPPSSCQQREHSCGWRVAAARSVGGSVQVSVAVSSRVIAGGFCGWLVLGMWREWVGAICPIKFEMTICLRVFMPIKSDCDI